MNAKLTFRLVTPTGVAAEAECDLVSLVARDNERGEGGGSVGIMRGHAPALVALAKDSKITAKTDGKPAVTATVSGGFASVADDVVTVIAETAQIEPH